MKPDKLLNRLKIACDLKSNKDYNDYQFCIGELRKYPSKEVLEGMLLCLKDVDAGEIQYELVEACEEYGDLTYTMTFLSLASEVRKNAPYWGDLMISSIMNTESCLEILLKNFKHLDNSNQKALLQWLDEDSRSGDPTYTKVYKKLKSEQTGGM